MADTMTTVLTSSPQPIAVTVNQTTAYLGEAEIQPVQRTLTPVGQILTLPSIPILRNDVVLYHNGVAQIPGTHYAWTGDAQITLTFTPVAGEPFLVKYWSRLSAGASIDQSAREIIGVPANVVAPEGYVPLDGTSTIGASTSSATYAGDVYLGAYAYVWELTGVSHGVHASASAAWAAGFALTLPSRTVSIYATGPTPEYLPAWLEV